MEYARAAEFHHQLGVALAAEKRMSEAEDALRQAWQLHPDVLTGKALGHVVGQLKIAL